jgi:phosphoenolpyruvate carboxykinase (diphosphate)
MFSLRQVRSLSILGSEALSSSDSLNLLMQDFFPSDKLQTEDDITASVVVPSKARMRFAWTQHNFFLRFFFCQALKGLELNLNNPSLKFVRNCEYRLFQVH